MKRLNIKTTTKLFRMSILLSTCMFMVWTPVAKAAICEAGQDCEQALEDFVKWPLYNPVGACDPASSAGLVGGEVGIIERSDRLQTAWGYLTGRGFSEAITAGIIGNLIAESGMIPNRKEGGGMQTISSFSEVTPGSGFGIAQWTTGDRQKNWGNFAKERGQDPLYLGLQLQFVVRELESGPFFGLAPLRQATDIRQATWVFLSYYERPYSVGNAGMTGTTTQPTGGPALAPLNDRAALAQGTYNTYHGTAPATGADIATAVTCAANGGPANMDTSTPSFAANPAVRVNGSPPGSHNPANCRLPPSLTAGAESLKQIIIGNWSPPVTSIGGYSCRPINFILSNPTSVHGTGRALDIMVNAKTPQGLAAGNQIRNWLINNSTALGVQRVIWNRYTWSADRNGWNPYGSASFSPHTDHVHAEINTVASTNSNLGR